MTKKVAIARILEYESTMLDSATALVLEEAGVSPAPGERVLVKPNLVTSTNAGACCTHPLVVLAACRYLLSLGADVTVADSPAFGPAWNVARANGLNGALAKVGLKVRSLKRPVRHTLPSGAVLGISRDALEAGMILNLPKLKAHCQMVVTGAVKNLFGCVVGFRKAFAHNRNDHTPEAFRGMLMDIRDVLPPTANLMDGIRAMHKGGPVHGVPFELGLLAASGDSIAIDTAAYSILGLSPSDVPLWAEAVKRKLPGVDPSSIGYPLEKPSLFDASGFTLAEPEPIRFDVKRLVKGRIKSLLKHFT